MFGNLTPAAEALAKFKEYYITVWPVLIVIHILAIVTFICLFKKTSNSDKVISAVLVFLWLWDGIVHQGLLAAYPPLICDSGVADVISWSYQIQSYF
jgi:hypothetical protein